MCIYAWYLSRTYIWIWHRRTYLFSSRVTYIFRFDAPKSYICPMTCPNIDSNHWFGFILETTYPLSCRKRRQKTAVSSVVVCVCTSWKTCPSVHTCYRYSVLYDQTTWLAVIGFLCFLRYKMDMFLCFKIASLSSRGVWRCLTFVRVVDDDYITFTVLDFFLWVFKTSSVCVIW